MAPCRDKPPVCPYDEWHREWKTKTALPTNGKRNGKLALMQHANKHTEGYTLVELVVTMMVMLTLGGVLMALYVATIRWVEPWQREMTLEDHAHLIAQRLLADLARTEQLIPEEDAAWTLTFRDGHAVQYAYRDSILTRDGIRMHDLDLDVPDFRLMPSRAETRYALRQRDSLGDDERSLVLVAVHLALRSRERTLVLATSTAMRQHRPWFPLSF